MYIITKSLIALTAGVVVSAAAGGAFAQDYLSPDRFAIGFTAGTDGVGGDLQYMLERHIVLRARGTWLGFAYGDNSGSLHYSGRFKLSEGGGFVDFHPWANPLTFSVGAVSGPRKVKLTVTSRENVTVDGVTYTPDQIGTAGGDATLSKVAPFVGLGFDNTFTTTSHFGFKVLAGVAFGHAPDAHLAPESGEALAYPQLITPDLAQAERDIHDDGRVFAYYPQVSAGLTYRF